MRSFLSLILFLIVFMLNLDLIHGDDKSDINTQQDQDKGYYYIQQEEYNTNNLIRRLGICLFECGEPGCKDGYCM